MAIVAGLLGAVAGIVVGFVVARRIAARPGVVAEPVAAPPWAESVPIRSILDHLSVGVVLADPAGHVVFRNQAAGRLEGTYAGVLIDQTVERHLARALAGDDSQQLIELFGPPKTVVVVSASGLAGGGAVAAIEDVSERSRLDAVRTDFVANISHELKTPVGALAVLAEALTDETELDVVRRLSGRMVEESHRAARTIDDLLELSRIELGGDPIRDPVAIDQVVAEAIDRAHGLADRRCIRLIAVDPATDTIRGDRRQLVSALGNLVENAVKYSEVDNEVLVHGAVIGEWVEFRVEDHGIGIPARDLDRVFERFYRVDKSRGRETGGTGLGLAIVRHVAANHGGEVRVTSQEGEGSTFVLRIPSGEPPAQPPATNDASETSAMTGAGT